MSPEKIDELLSQLGSGDEKTARKAALALGNLGDPRAVPALMDILRNTTSSWIQGGAALALSDLGADEAVPLLFELIKNPPDPQYFSVLIQALWGLDIGRFLVDLVPFVVNDNYEVREQARIALEEAKGPVDSEQKRKAMELLESYAENPTPQGSDWRGMDEYLCYVEHALDELRRMPTSGPSRGLP